MLVEGGKLVVEGLGLMMGQWMVEVVDLRHKIVVVLSVRTKEVGLVGWKVFLADYEIQLLVLHVVVLLVGSFCPLAKRCTIALAGY